MSKSLYAPIGTLLNNRSASAAMLADALTRSQLAICVGAGISKYIGLPTLVELAERMVENVIARPGMTEPQSIPAIHSFLADQSNDTARRAIDEVGRLFPDDREFNAIVRSALYRNLKGDADLLSHRLLVAIGILVMKAARGGVSDVLTFNYDDLLETYLKLCGVRVEQVNELYQLREPADVYVHHPHGFLPYHTSQYETYERVVLDSYSYHKLQLNQDCISLLERMLSEHITVFIGVAPGDRTLDNMLVRVKETLDRRGIHRPTGVWILGPDEPDFTTVETAAQLNVVPLQFTSYDDYPDYLLSICQEALQAGTDD